MAEKPHADLQEIETLKEMGESNTTRIQVTTSQETFIKKAFDRRVVPLVCALYVLSYIDRGNIGA